MQALKFDEENAALCYKLGIIYCKMNEFPLAKRCFEKVVELDSNLYNAYYRLGQISLLYRDIESAEKYFLQSIYGETEGKSYLQLAKIYMIKNDRIKAIMFINNAMNIDSEYYKKIINEPIFIPIKNEIVKPTETQEKNRVEESEEEKEISNYLDDTYNLTKVLNQKEKKQKK